MDEIKNNVENGAGNDVGHSGLTPKRVFRELLGYLGKVLRIEGTDIHGTIEGIKRDMAFRGHTAWILMFSILIASIGLNTNSTAVIIGAMLISPLMGPILGIGLAIGTNDWDTLKKALINFATAIGISLFTSAMYFLLTPLTKPQPELLARIKPTFLDVLIALFGGFAGIIAGSRYEKSNVIPGVAIATALMPPLCTAGYGIAMWDGKFFWGAIYLFFINSVFISIATFLGVKYLRFPVKTFLDKAKQKQIRRYMIVFVVLMIIPSTIIFLNVVKESRFVTGAENFVSEEVVFSGSELINKKFSYSDTVSRIDLYFIGKEIPAEIVEGWRRKLHKYGLVRSKSFFGGLFSVTDTTRIFVHQAKDNTEYLENQINYLSNNLTKEIRVGILEDIYKKNEELLKNKEERIKFLENQLIAFKSDSVPIYNLHREINIQYPDIERFAYAKTIEPSDSGFVDTIPTFLVRWSRRVSHYKQRRENAKLAAWLKVRLNFDTVRVVNY